MKKMEQMETKQKTHKLEDIIGFIAIILFCIVRRLVENVGFSGTATHCYGWSKT